MAKITIRIKWSKTYPYNSVNRLFIPQKAGVYEILEKQPDGKYLRRYVGRGKDLRERFDFHLSPSEDNPCIKRKLRNYSCGFDYALVPLLADRKDAELALYRKYKSQLHCNEVEPEGSGRGDEIELIEE